MSVSSIWSSEAACLSLMSFCASLIFSFNFSTVPSKLITTPRVCCLLLSLSLTEWGTYRSANPAVLWCNYWRVALLPYVMGVLLSTAQCAFLQQHNVIIMLCPFVEGSSDTSKLIWKVRLHDSVAFNWHDSSPALVPLHLIIGHTIAHTSTTTMERYKAGTQQTGLCLWAAWGHTSPHAVQFTCDTGSGLCKMSIIAISAGFVLLVLHTEKTKMLQWIFVFSAIKMPISCENSHKI